MLDSIKFSDSLALHLWCYLCKVLYDYRAPLHTVILQSFYISILYILNSD